MKKSEMLEKILQAVINYELDHGQSNLGKGDLRILTEYVLSVVENEGMLPPYNENHGYSDFDIAMGVPTKGTHNWESEDE